MNWQTYSLFLISTFFVSGTPGANMLYAFSMGVQHGLRRTLWVLAGLSTGLGLLLIAALAGLSIIAKYPVLLTTIKIFGAVYLIYLGIISWRTTGKLRRTDAISETSVKATTPTKLFTCGMWVSLANPKAMLFLGAFFPKFIDFTAPLAPQYAILIASFFVIETLWQLIYTGGGVKLATWLNQGSRMLVVNRICGAVFILIGGLIIWESLQGLLNV